MFVRANSCFANFRNNICITKPKIITCKNVMTVLSGGAPPKSLAKLLLNCSVPVLVNERRNFWSGGALYLLWGKPKSCCGNSPQLTNYAGGIKSVSCVLNGGAKFSMSTEITAPSRSAENFCFGELLSVGGAFHGDGGTRKCKAMNNYLHLSLKKFESLARGENNDNDDINLPCRCFHFDIYKCFQHYTTHDCHDTNNTAHQPQEKLLHDKLITARKCMCKKFGITNLWPLQELFFNLFFGICK